MPATRKRAPARSSKPARGPRRRSRRRRARPLPGIPFSLPAGLPRLPALDQRERDVIGLALVALGVFLGFLLYGGWHGGRAGHALVVALGWAVGEAKELAPIAMLLGGGAFLLRPMLPVEPKIAIPRGPLI